MCMCRSSLHSASSMSVSSLLLHGLAPRAESLPSDSASPFLTWRCRGDVGSCTEAQSALTSMPRSMLRPSPAANADVAVAVRLICTGVSARDRVGESHADPQKPLSKPSTSFDAGDTLPELTASRTDGVISGLSILTVMWPCRARSTCVPCDDHPCASARSPRSATPPATASGEIIIPCSPCACGTFALLARRPTGAPIDFERSPRNENCFMSSTERAALVDWARFLPAAALVTLATPAGRPTMPATDGTAEGSVFVGKADLGGRPRRTCVGATSALVQLRAGTEMDRARGCIFLSFAAAYRALLTAESCPCARG
eukprot:Opistho-2@97020